MDVTEKRGRQGKRYLREREQRICYFEEGPFSWKCSTSCAQRPSKEDSKSVSKETKREDKIGMKERARVFTGLDIVFFALCGISLTFSKAIKRMNSLKKEELAFSSEEQDNMEPSDINECETKSERELPLAKPSPISHSREGSLRSSSSESDFDLVLQNEKKSQEDVLAFTMQQSVLRQHEMNKLRETIFSRDREIEKNSKIIDRVLTSISHVLGVEFSEVTASSEKQDESCSKQTSSESSTSPDSILTPKVFMKEMNAEIWTMKQELIIEKIVEMKQKMNLEENRLSSEQPRLDSERKCGKSEDGNFSTFLQNFRTEQFQFFNDMKDKEFQLQQYSKFVSQWQGDIKQMKERQSQHYQKEIDKLVAERQELEERHIESTASLVLEQSKRMNEMEEIYERQILEKDKNVSDVTREKENLEMENEELEAYMQLERREKEELKRDKEELVAYIKLEKMQNEILEKEKQEQDAFLEELREDVVFELSPYGPIRRTLLFEDSGI